MSRPQFVCTERLCNFVWLVITTVIFVGVCVANGLANSSNAAQFGFTNSTKDISDLYYTQMTPPGFAFANWGVVYVWQLVWIVYAWSFICRPNSQLTIFIGVYVGYSFVNTLNIAWVYLWGNEYIILACVVLTLMNIFFFFTIGLLFGFFNHIKDMSNTADRWLTRLLVQNGMCYYSAWVTLLSIANLSAAIPPNSLLNDEDCSTLCLAIILAALLTYFILENTVLDRYGFRYVFSVYPVVIWMLVTLLTEQWDMQEKKRNSIYAAALLGFSCLVCVIRVVIIICRIHRESSAASRV